MSSIDLATEDNLQYTFYPVSSGSISFKVRAANDAHVALTSGPQEADPMVEIFIGGWGNSKSVIRRNRTKPEKVEVNTAGILNGDEFRSFWIHWNGGVITVGNEGEAAPFLAWEDPEPFPINHIGVCTGWGATGTWMIEVQPSNAPRAEALTSGIGASCWVDARNGEIPPGAVVGGQDGEALYVGRAQHEGALIPGKVLQSHGLCYIPWGGAEHGKQEYQVLCGCAANWVNTNGSNVPSGALPAGESEEGEPLFVGRVQHEGSLTVGKVQASHGVCYISYAGQELGFQDYEILVAQ